MSSTKQKIELSDADVFADRFMKFIALYCHKVSVAGSVRRKCPMVGDVEVVCVPIEQNGLVEIFPKTYPGLTTKGDTKKLKRFVYPQSHLQIELYMTTAEDYGRILAIRTGSSAFSHIKLAVTWNRLGWCGTSDGLRRKKECDKKGTVWKLKPEYKDNPTKPPPFWTEEDFFYFLGIEWIPPEKRNWQSKHQEINYSP